MKRDEETSYYTFDTTSKYPNQRSEDCAIRSISLAIGKPWTEVFDDLCDIARSMYRVPVEKAVIHKYLEQQGWKRQSAPRHDGNYRYKAKDFVKMLNKTAIVSVGAHHLSCFLNGKIHDIFNCGDGSVGNYWIKD